MKAIAFVVVLSMVLLSTAALAGDSATQSEQTEASRTVSTDKSGISFIRSPKSQGSKAEVPGLMSYQGTLTDAGGVALDTTVSMTFTIYDDSTGGSTIWTETQPSVQVTAGIFDVLLGQINSITDAVFSDPVRWLGVQVGGDPEMTPRQRIVAVGYAFRAAEADSADYARSGVGGGGGWVDDGTVVRLETETDWVGIGTTSPGQPLDVVGDVNVGGDSTGYDGGSELISIRGRSDDWYIGVQNEATAEATGFFIGKYGEENLYIDNDGNVGIRATNPTADLHIMTRDSTQVKLSGVANTGANAGGYKLYISNYDNDDSVYTYPIYAVDENDGVDFYLRSRSSQGGNSQAYFQGNVGIGTTSPTSKLDVHYGAIRAKRDSDQYIEIIDNDASGGHIISHSREGNKKALLLEALHDGSGSPAGETFVLFRVGEESSPTSAMTIKEDGNVGIGTTSPSSKLEMYDTSPEVSITASGSSPVGLILKRTGSSYIDWRIRDDGGNLKFDSSEDDGAAWTNRLWISSSGEVGIGTSPSYALDVSGKVDVSGEIRAQTDSDLEDAIYGRAEGTNGIGVRGTAYGMAEYGVYGYINISASADGAGVYGRAESPVHYAGHFYNSSGPALYAEVDSTDDKAGIFEGDVVISGRVGIGTTSPGTKLEVKGTTTTDILTITGGSDLAEPFAMSDGRSIPEGALVVIDDQNPGRLRMSRQPYDHRVAGVVSGAGGINPGITLSQPGALEDGRDVALSGRVYALADASNGAIQPGDLLTTSSTPGHAMKATDRDRSHGAIIGKAMSTLEEGEGLVLVLVNLQ